MSVDRESRRYLLGRDTEQERASFEERYFNDESTAGRVAAAEEDLVEDYLDGHLDAGEQAAFIAHYLATPEHRVRLETLRRLVAAAGAKPITARAQTRAAFATRAFALAASLLLAALAAWYFAAGRAPRQAPAITASGPQPDIAPKHRVFAVTLSPVAVRGDASAPPVVVPAGVDLVSLTLAIDGEPPAPPVEVVIAVVGGGEAWRGPAVVDPARPGEVRADVPAGRLPPDDYIVTLTAHADVGPPREAGRYFLRVRGA